MQVKKSPLELSVFADTLKSYTLCSLRYLSIPKNMGEFTLLNLVRIPYNKEMLKETGFAVL